jgi:hypothetical protein
MNSPVRFFAALAGVIVLFTSGLHAQSAANEAGLIGKRYAGPDFTYDHFSGSAADKALGAAAIVNLPLSPSFDLNFGYSYTDTSGTRYGAMDKVLRASLLTHRHTEYGTAYFAGTLGHGWHRLDRAGTVTRENGALWGVRAGYEIPVGPRTAINAGLGYTDSFDSGITSAQALRYSVEANHWFSRDIAGVVSVSYRQVKQAPDSVSYTAGLRWAF